MKGARSLSYSEGRELLRRPRSPWLRHVRLFLLGLVAVLLFWSLWFEPRRLVMRQVPLDVPNWPPALGGLRVALMSDLHVGSPHWDLERLRDLVQRTNEAQPEIVLLAGDYLINGVKFGSWVDPESIAQELGALRAPLGVVAVLGNHDWWNDGDRVRAAFEKNGIVVLENDAKSFVRGGTKFSIVGLADLLTRRVDIEASIARVPSGEPFLVLVHEPDVFPEVDARASLTMAGHTHGGQVNLPFFGRLVVPSEYGQRYAAGHVAEGDRHLFVTSGVGTSIFPIRFGVPPEVVLLELH